jgi:hypothetical protein
MSLFADALQPLAMASLFALSGQTAGDSIPDLIVRRKGTGFFLSFDTATSTVSIDFQSPEMVADAFASDLSRMASAAFQSIIMLPEAMISRDEVAWSIVRLYYAAFYAGHAIMRVLGESCSYFDSIHVARLRQMATLIGTPPPFQVQSGLYRVDVVNNTGEIRCLHARGRGGGIHESFWLLFGERLDTVRANILLGKLPTLESQSVFAELSRILGILRQEGNNGTNWLSVVRNRVQYRHAYGVWYPLGLAKNESKRIHQIASKWKMDPMEMIQKTVIRSELEQFTMACTFIVSVCRTVLMRIAQRSTAGNRCFLRYGPMGFLNKVQAN